MSLASTNNAKYTDKIETIDEEIEHGNSVFDAFCQAGCFPADFLDTVAVGEQSGNLDGSMAGLSRQYQDRAQFAMKTLNTVAAFLVWMIIAAIIITIILQLAFFYLGALNQASKLLGSNRPIDIFRFGPLLTRFPSGRLWILRQTMSR